MALDFAVGFAEQQRDFGQGLRRLLELLARFAFERNDSFEEFSSL
jgi:hypothetical protein